MKNLAFLVTILSFSMMFGAADVKANSDYRFVQKQRTNSISNSLFSLTDFSAILQDSVTRWNPVSTSNMSFGRMTMSENRNSAKITWRSGQSSAYTTLSDDKDGAIFYLSAAPKFDGDSCRYLKMVFNDDDVTVDFYATKKVLDEDSFLWKAHTSKLNKK